MTAIAPAPQATIIRARPTDRMLLATVGVFLFVFLLVFGGVSVGRKLDVDENVFIASAALFGRTSLKLYRDYHYNHMPTLVILYSVLFKLSDHLLLTARTFSALCAAGLATMLFAFATRAFAWMPGRRLVFSLGIALALVMDPLFTRTAGKAWNHDFPALCSVGAFLVLMLGMERNRALLLILAGSLAALALTSRLTFATIMLPLVMFTLFYPARSPRGRMIATAWLGVGCAIVCLPSLWIWSYSWRNAYFGNFQYPAYNTAFHAANDEHHRFSRFAKVMFYLSQCLALPGNGIVQLVFVLMVLASLQWKKIRTTLPHFQIATAALLAMSQVVAGLTPAPPFIQYFYAAAPFMVLTIAMCLAIRRDLAKDRLIHLWLGIGLCVMIPFGLVDYRYFGVLFHIDKWQPMIVHREGVEIVTQTGPGAILTLEPVYPLEGGATIYPELVAGRFASRVGDFLTADQQARYRMFSTPGLLASIRRDHPRGILLTGTDEGVGPEKAMGAEAALNGYRKVDIARVGTLWLRPAAIP